MAAQMGSVSGLYGLGDMLGNQTYQETEEERRKRLLAQQQQSQLAPVSSLYGLKRPAGAVSALGGVGGPLR